MQTERHGAHAQNTSSAARVRILVWNLHFSSRDPSMDAISVFASMVSIVAVWWLCTDRFKPAGIRRIPGPVHWLCWHDGWQEQRTSCDIHYEWIWDGLRWAWEWVRAVEHCTPNPTPVGVRLVFWQDDDEQAAAGFASTKMDAARRGEMASTRRTTSGCGKRKMSNGDGGGLRNGLAKPCPRWKDFRTETSITLWLWLLGYQCPEFGPGATDLQARLGSSHDNSSPFLVLTSPHSQPLLQTICLDGRRELVWPTRTSAYFASRMFDYSVSTTLPFSGERDEGE